MVPWPHEVNRANNAAAQMQVSKTLICPQGGDVREGRWGAGGNRREEMRAVLGRREWDVSVGLLRVCGRLRAPELESVSQ